MSKMSKGLWVGFYTASLTIFVMFFTVFLTGRLMLGNNFAGPGAVLLLLMAVLGLFQFAIAQFIYTLLILSRMWGAIQDGHTEITVGKAIGFLFIPVFGVYWIFRAWGSFPTEYNNYIDRYSLNVPHLSTAVFTLHPIFTISAGILLVPILLLPFNFMAVISKTCDAVNALNEAIGKRRAAALPPQPQRISNQYRQMPNQLAARA